MEPGTYLAIGKFSEGFLRRRVFPIARASPGFAAARDYNEVSASWV